MRGRLALRRPVLDRCKPASARRTLARPLSSNTCSPSACRHPQAGAHRIPRCTALRRHIALVSQETALFDDSIRANIAYGKPGASLQDIEQEAEFAFADDSVVAADRLEEILQTLALQDLRERFFTT